MLTLIRLSSWHKGSVMRFLLVLASSLVLAAAAAAAGLESLRRSPSVVASHSDAHKAHFARILAEAEAKAFEEIRSAVISHHDQHEVDAEDLTFGNGFIMGYNTTTLYASSTCAGEGTENQPNPLSFAAVAVSNDYSKDFPSTPVCQLYSASAGTYVTYGFVTYDSSKSVLVESPFAGTGRAYYTSSAACTSTSYSMTNFTKFSVTNGAGLMTTYGPSFSGYGSAPYCTKTGTTTSTRTYCSGDGSVLDIFLHSGACNTTYGNAIVPHYSFHTPQVMSQSSGGSCSYSSSNVNSPYLSSFCSSSPGTTNLVAAPIPVPSDPSSPTGWIRMDMYMDSTCSVATYRYSVGVSFGICELRDAHTDVYGNYMRTISSNDVTGYVMTTSVYYSDVHCNVATGYYVSLFNLYPLDTCMTATPEQGGGYYKYVYDTETFAENPMVANSQGLFPNGINSFVQRESMSSTCDSYHAPNTTELFTWFPTDRCIVMNATIGGVSSVIIHPVSGGSSNQQTSSLYSNSLKWGAGNFTFLQFDDVACTMLNSAANNGDTMPNSLCSKSGQDNNVPSYSSSLSYAKEYTYNPLGYHTTTSYSDKACKTPISTYAQGTGICTNVMDGDRVAIPALYYILTPVGPTSNMMMPLIKAYYTDNKCMTPSTEKSQFLSMPVDVCNTVAVGEVGCNCFNYTMIDQSSTLDIYNVPMGLIAGFNGTGQITCADGDETNCFVPTKDRNYASDYVSTFYIAADFKCKNGTAMTCDYSGYTTTLYNDPYCILGVKAKIHTPYFFVPDFKSYPDKSLPGAAGSSWTQGFCGTTPFKLSPRMNVSMEVAPDTDGITGFVHQLTYSVSDPTCSNTPLLENIESFGNCMINPSGYGAKEDYGNFTRIISPSASDVAAGNLELKFFQYSNYGCSTTTGYWYTVDENKIMASGSCLPSAYGFQKLTYTAGDITSEPVSVFAMDLIGVFNYTRYSADTSGCDPNSVTAITTTNTDKCVLMPSITNPELKDLYYAKVTCAGADATITYYNDPLCATTAAFVQTVSTGLAADPLYCNLGPLSDPVYDAWESYTMTCSSGAPGVPTTAPTNSVPTPPTPITSGPGWLLSYYFKDLASCMAGINAASTFVASYMKDVSGIIEQNCVADSTGTGYSTLAVGPDIVPSAPFEFGMGTSFFSGASAVSDCGDGITQTFAYGDYFQVVQPMCNSIPNANGGSDSYYMTCDETGTDTYYYAGTDNCLPYPAGSFSDISHKFYDNKCVADPTMPSQQMNYFCSYTPGGIQPPQKITLPVIPGNTINSWVTYYIYSDSSCLDGDYVYSRSFGLCTENNSTCGAACGYKNEVSGVSDSKLVETATIFYTDANCTKPTMDFEIRMDMSSVIDYCSYDTYAKAYVKRSVSATPPVSPLGAVVQVANADGNCDGEHERSVVYFPTDRCITLPQSTSSMVAHCDANNEVKLKEYKIGTECEAATLFNTTNYHAQTCKKDNNGDFFTMTCPIRANGTIATGWFTESVYEDAACTKLKGGEGIGIGICSMSLDVPSDHQMVTAVTASGSLTLSTMYYTDRNCMTKSATATKTMTFPTSTLGVCVANPSNPTGSGFQKVDYSKGNTPPKGPVVTGGIMELASDTCAPLTSVYQYNTIPMGSCMNGTMYACDASGFNSSIFANPTCTGSATMLVHQKFSCDNGQVLFCADEPFGDSPAPPAPLPTGVTGFAQTYYYSDAGCAHLDYEQTNVAGQCVMMSMDVNGMKSNYSRLMYDTKPSASGYLPLLGVAYWDERCELPTGFYQQYYTPTPGGAFNIFKNSVCTTDMYGFTSKTIYTEGKVEPAVSGFSGDVATVKFYVNTRAYGYQNCDVEGEMLSRSTSAGRCNKEQQSGGLYFMVTCTSVDTVLYEQYTDATCTISTGQTNEWTIDTCIGGTDYSTPAYYATCQTGGPTMAPTKFVPVPTMAPTVYSGPGYSTTTYYASTDKSCTGLSFGYIVLYLDKNPMLSTDGKCIYDAASHQYFTTMYVQNEPTAPPPNTLSDGIYPSGTAYYTTLANCMAETMAYGDYWGVNTNSTTFFKCKNSKDDTIMGPSTSLTCAANGLREILWDYTADCAGNEDTHILVPYDPACSLVGDKYVTSFCADSPTGTGASNALIPSVGNGTIVQGWLSQGVYDDASCIDARYMNALAYGLCEIIRGNVSDVGMSKYMITKVDEMHDYDIETTSVYFLDDKCAMPSGYFQTVKDEKYDFAGCYYDMHQQGYIKHFHFKGAATPPAPLGSFQQASSLSPTCASGHDIYLMFFPTDRCVSMPDWRDKSKWISFIAHCEASGSLLLDQYVDSSGNPDTHCIELYNTTMIKPDTCKPESWDMHDFFVTTSCPVRAAETIATAWMTKTLYSDPMCTQHAKKELNMTGIGYNICTKDAYDAVTKTWSYVSRSNGVMTKDSYDETSTFYTDKMCTVVDLTKPATKQTITIGCKPTTDKPGFSIYTNFTMGNLPPHADFAGVGDMVLESKTCLPLTSASSYTIMAQGGCDDKNVSLACDSTGITATFYDSFAACNMLQTPVKIEHIPFECRQDQGYTHASFCSDSPFAVPPAPAKPLELPGAGITGFIGVTYYADSGCTAAQYEDVHSSGLCYWTPKAPGTSKMHDANYTRDISPSTFQGGQGFVDVTKYTFYDANCIFPTDYYILDRSQSQMADDLYTGMCIMGADGQYQKSTYTPGAVIPAIPTRYTSKAFVVTTFHTNFDASESYDNTMPECVSDSVVSRVSGNTDTCVFGHFGKDKAGVEQTYALVTCSDDLTTAVVYYYADSSCTMNTNNYTLSAGTCNLDAKSHGRMQTLFECIPGTAMPSMAPTAMPSMASTTPPQVVTVGVVQTISGFSFATYTQNMALYNRTFVATIVDVMKVYKIVPSNIQAMVGAPGSSRRRLQDGRELATGSTSLQLSYNLVSSTGSYSQLSTALVDSVHDGAFTTALQKNAAAYGASALKNATSSTITTQDKTSYTNTGKSHGLSAGAIVGIVFAVLVLIGCFAGLFFLYIRTGASHAKPASSSNYGDSSQQVGPTTNPVFRATQGNVVDQIPGQANMRNRTGLNDNSEIEEPQYGNSFVAQSANAGGARRLEPGAKENFPMF